MKAQTTRLGTCLAMSIKSNSPVQGLADGLADHLADQCFEAGHLVGGEGGGGQGPVSDGCTLGASETMSIRCATADTASGLLSSRMP